MSDMREPTERLADTFPLTRWADIDREETALGTAWPGLRLPARDWGLYSVEIYERKANQSDAGRSGSFTLDADGAWMTTRVVVRHASTEAWLQQAVEPPAVSVHWPGAGPTTRKERRRVEDVLFDALPLVRDFGWQEAKRGPTPNSRPGKAKTKSRTIQRLWADHPDASPRVIADLAVIPIHVVDR